MVRVVLIGGGNVAVHLAQGLRSCPGIELVQQFSRSPVSGDHFDPGLKHTDDLNELEEADLYIMAVKDDAIEEVAHNIKHLSGLVVHTSGSVPMETLNILEKRGVLYPVQTFSKDRQIEWGEIPLAIECSSDDDLSLLEEVARQLSSKVVKLDSDKRKKLHLAAVFVNNFSNHMFSISKEICDLHSIPFDLLLPMIDETAGKVHVMQPDEAQTGPARRNDLKTMLAQESQLNEDQRILYKTISESISNRFDDNNPNK